MSKKLLAAAIATAVAAPMAVAADSNNVTVYGKAHVMVVKTNLDNGFPSGAVDDEGNRLRNKVNDWAVGSTNSRIGFKGSEDLGNGLKAIWKYETTVNISDGAAEGGLFGSARNAYLGLSSEWGSLLVGRHDTPAKVAWYAAGNDHLDGSIIDFNTIGFATGGVGGQQLTTFMDARLDNTIAYISPSFAGFTFAGAIIPGEQDDGPQNNIADNWSVGAMWSGYGFKASAGYEHFDWSEPRPPFPPTSSGIENLEEQKSWFVAGSWTYSVFTIGATYQKDKDFEGLSDQDTWGIAGKYTFGNNDIIANYASGSQDARFVGEQDRDYNDWGVAFLHRFSKRTSAYVAYNSASFDGTKDSSVPLDGQEQNRDEDQYGIGMIHNF